MKTAIILHGICDEHEYFEMDFPSPSNAHWLPWLQQKFLRNSVLCQCLEMPTPFKPNYEEWENLFDKFASQNLTTVVGHSAGAGFILKWLHKHPDFKLDKLILIAPTIDPTNKWGEFLNFNLNKEGLNNIKEIHLFISEDDGENMQISTKEILNIYPQIITHRYKDKGHFTFKRVGTSFEDFWDACK